MWLLRAVVYRAFCYGLFVLVSLPHQGYAQSSIATDSLEMRLNYIDQEYSYRHLDSAVYYFNQVAATAADSYRWDWYLTAMIRAAWSAEYHQDIDLLTHFVHRAQAVSRTKLPRNWFSKDVSRAVDFYYTVGVCHHTLGNYHESISEFKKIIAFTEAQAFSDSLYVQHTLSYVASGNYHLENYPEAIDYAQLALQRIPQRNDQYTEDVGYRYLYAKNLNNLGKYLFALGKSERDTTYYQQSWQQYDRATRTLAAGSNLPRQRQQLAVSYNALSLLNQSLGQIEEALRNLHKAEALLHPGEVTLEKTYINFGDTYLLKGNSETALRYYQRALSEATQRFEGKHHTKAEILLHIGEVYHQRKEWSEALSYYQKSLVQVATSFSETDIDQNPPLDQITTEHLLLQILMAKADACVQQYQYRATNPQSLLRGIATYEHAINLVDSMHYRVASVEYRQFLTAKAVSLYERAIASTYLAYHQLGDRSEFLSKAFYFAEKNKARELREVTSGLLARNNSDIPDSLVTRERTLRGKLTFLTSKQDRHDSASGLPQENLVRIRREYETLLGQIETAYPRYYSMRYSTDVLSLGQIQQACAERGTQLVEYFYGDSSVYAFGISPEKTTFQKLSWQPPEEEVLNRFVSSLRDFEPQTAYRPEQVGRYSKDAYLLYQRLLEPVLDTMKSSGKRVVIVNDGPLGFLNYDVLLDRKANGSKEQLISYAHLPYLLHRFQFSYEYSAHVRFAWEKGVGQALAPGQYQYAGFAPRYANDLLATNARTSRFAQPNRANFSLLKHNQQEVLQASQLFRGLSMVEAAATESAFRRYAGKSRIIHLSMHAFTDDNNPLRSALVFSAPNEDANDSTDGFLYAHELYDIPLTAELAILSACETGIGKLSRGDGIMSLGRAFKYAGCPTVAMSLWKADDQSTAQIVRTFSQYLADGMAKDEALYRAKQDYLQQARRYESHPYFWAPFVLVGETSPITTDVPAFFRSISLLGLAVTLGMVYLLIKTVFRKWLPLHPAINPG